MRRYSKQREVILGVLEGTKSHPTASWVYEKAREIIPNISLGTVYRNLSELTDSGEIRCLSTDDEFEHYDFDTSNHCHFFCQKCGRILDVFDVSAKGLSAEVQKSLDCKVDREEIIFYGTCSDCK